LSYRMPSMSCPRATWTGCSIASIVRMSRAVPRRAARAFRKRRPSLDPRNGTRFPNGGSDGNHVQEYCLRMGCRFRLRSSAGRLPTPVPAGRRSIYPWPSRYKKSWSCASSRGFPALSEQAYKMQRLTSRKLLDGLENCCSAGVQLASNLIYSTAIHAIQRA